MFQRNKEETKSSVHGKADEKEAHFKVVSRRDSAIIPQVGHPSGWANRVQDKKEAATSGEEWRSDASVISFKHSSVVDVILVLISLWCNRFTIV